MGKFGAPCCQCATVDADRTLVDFDFLDTSPPTADVVAAAAVKSAKASKSADGDRITAELLHVGGVAMIILLVTLLSSEWASDMMPLPDT